MSHQSGNEESSITVVVRLDTCVAQIDNTRNAATHLWEQTLYMVDEEGRIWAIQYEAYVAGEYRRVRLYRGWAAFISKSGVTNGTYVPKDGATVNQCLLDSGHTRTSLRKHDSGSASY